MSTFWAAFAAFWQTWGPFISTSLIPTIIVGLSVSPKTSEASGVVQKVWNTVKHVLDFLSVATHKDKPGTFQLPFKLNAVVAKKDDGEGPPSPPAATTTALLLIFAFSVPQSGCAWLKNAGTEAKSTAIDCSISSVQENAQALVPAVIGILTGGSVNWKDQVKLFVKGFGRDATACAMQTALKRLNDPVASEPVVEDPEAVRAESAKRADQFIDEQRWDFAD